MKKILGFTGQIAAGKTTAVTYLQEKYDAHSHRFSTPLRDVLTRIHEPQTRDNLQTISQILRENFGEDMLAKIIAADVKEDDSPIIVLDGIRRKKDIEYMRDIPGFTLINIDADIHTRFERISVRSENPDDQGKTFEAFEKEHEREPERQISEVASTADVHIDNNGTLEQLYEKLDALV